MINKHKDKEHKCTSFEKQPYSCSTVTLRFEYMMLIHEYHVLERHIEMEVNDLRSF